MFGAVNPFTHGGGTGAGSYSPEDAADEVGATYTDHIPTVLAGVLIGAGAILFAMKRADFKWIVSGSFGGR